jgi:hypothetical protein
MRRGTDGRVWGKQVFLWKKHFIGRLREQVFRHKGVVPPENCFSVRKTISE